MSVEAEVLAAEERLLEAMRTSDADMLDALLHDDLLFNGPDGSTAGKALDLANYRSGGIQLHAVTGRDRIVRPIGDCAVVAVTVMLQGSYLGQSLDGAFRYLRVWQRTDAGWQVIGGSVVPLASQDGAEA